ncbi:TIGR03668 family PPOX class F420-dependent oxidoreductase [Streptomyces litchfieldiae]|uniref:TIGR03668 family PPOX class F420-dependent oxidoreductase n=1 Tax=Streptomyces litchfieldiae TaxID=3075543 RepID=A0ABU2MZC8_9ACTN|nr:TIGR03668 family PPOX class F420-dependent oxidoreductase [Streptomyces sp. DSM 44938]MDT0346997.1 TIGR03668 family PPOX class F420-dependent oxidoreductase [Streptomyces sp. DSM 44938]
MRLSEPEARARFAAARVLRLATADADGMPHVVPATFAVADGTVVIAVDDKPKRHQDLRRLRNVEANPRVSALVDEYNEDWTRLWWVRADGTARVLTDEARAEPVDRLARKYPRYRATRPAGPVIEITVTRWTGWAWM